MRQGIEGCAPILVTEIAAALLAKPTAFSSGWPKKYRYTGAGWTFSMACATRPPTPETLSSRRKSKSSAFFRKHGTLNPDTLAVERQRDGKEG